MLIEIDLDHAALGLGDPLPLETIDNNQGDDMLLNGAIVGDTDEV